MSATSAPVVVEAAAAATSAPSAPVRVVSMVSSSGPSALSADLLPLVRDGKLVTPWASSPAFRAFRSLMSRCTLSSLNGRLNWWDSARVSKDDEALSVPLPSELPFTSDHGKRSPGYRLWDSVVLRDKNLLAVVSWAHVRYRLRVASWGSLPDMASQMFRTDALAKYRADIEASTLPWASVGFASASVPSCIKVPVGALALSLWDEKELYEAQTNRAEDRAAREKASKERAEIEACERRSRWGL